MQHPSGWSDLGVTPSNLPVCRQVGPHCGANPVQRPPHGRGRLATGRQDRCATAVAHLRACCWASAQPSATTVAETEARDHGRRRDAVGEIIVHATGGPFCRSGHVAFSPPGTVETMQRFFARSGTVSIHYIVGPDGTVASSVPEDQVAIHTVGHNDHAIGIELINAGDGHEPYPEAQVAALVRLVREIQGRWRIPSRDVKGHEDVDQSTFACGGRSVRRRRDPGPLFRGTASGRRSRSPQHAEPRACPSPRRQPGTRKPCGTLPSGLSSRRAAGKARPCRRSSTRRWWRGSATPWSCRCSPSPTPTAASPWPRRWWPAASRCWR